MKKYVPGDLRVEQLRTIERHLDNDRTIVAVKEIMHCLGCGLAEANDLRKRIQNDMRKRK